MAFCVHYYPSLTVIVTLHPKNAIKRLHVPMIDLQNGQRVHYHTTKAGMSTIIVLRTVVDGERRVDRLFSVQLLCHLE